MRGMSAEGTNFLKCSYAPIDFVNEVPCPVPDGTGARVTVKRHKTVFQNDSTSGMDTYFAIMPVPGVACYYVNTIAGIHPGASDSFAPLVYPDTATIFPATAQTTNFSKFRYASSYVEFIPTINATSWTGSISVWKSQVAVEMNQDSSTTGSTFYTNGLQAVTVNTETMFVAGNNLGAYTMATQTGPWVYSPILSDPALPMASTLNAVAPTLSTIVTGCGTLQTIFVKLTGTYSYTVKIGCCVEYVVDQASVLYEYSRFNNTNDAVALELYRKIAMDLPVAVSYFDNADFWDRVLQIMGAVSGLATSLPGAYGRLAGGISIATSAIQSLRL
jgi:hypothetical protein